VDLSGEFFSPEGPFHGDSLPFSRFQGDFEIHFYVVPLQAWHRLRWGKLGLGEKYGST
jgi:hypothetical protein